jgi:uncharacterized coiled-coil protein SlyX
MSDFKEYLPIINVFGFIALGVAVWYTQFKTGSNQISGEVITNYKALDEQKNNQLNSLQKDIEEIKATMRAMEKGFIERIAKLEGQLKEKNNQIDSLNLILANRNPELETVLAEIRDFMKELRDTNVYQTNILERGQIRDVKIDKATNKEEGKVLRNT